MFECLILGDSIAVGLHQVRPECVAYARGGINSWQFNQTWKTQSLDARTVVISLGTNDHLGVNTNAELRRLRERITAPRVFWILPAGNLRESRVPIKTIQNIISDIAREHGDVIVSIPRLSPDGIHPSWIGYEGLRDTTRGTHD